MPDSGNMVNGFDMSTVDQLDPELATIIKRRARLLGPAYKLFYRTPVRFVRAEGVYMYDADGTEYLDAYNNVPSVGHCHPKVVEAIARQAATLNTHTRYANDTILDYAERLLATFPAEIGNVMFTCTGSEAVDLALRIAKFATGGEGVVITSNAYHGVTTAAAEISPSLGPAVPLGRTVWTVPPPVGTAEHVRAAIKDMKRHGVRFAAFIADSLFSSDGILPEPAGFLRQVRDVVREEGGLYIADEVQPGFGRTGASMWGFQRHGIVPDLAVMGKPMGNGMPIAAVAARPELLEEFGGKARYFNTFGGNSVCVGAAAAVLDVISSQGLVENARVTGQYLLETLGDIAAASPRIGAVRGAGLYAGIDIVDPDTGEPDPAGALAVVNDVRDRRVLISATGPHGHTLKIRPPLPFAAGHVDRLAAALSGSLS
ncbi:MAG TPA: aspartate aminotransferase family protein [Streptosporangiaceae bacterium]